MAIYYVIRFSPEAKIDYKYNLTVVTERERFIVPIVAVGKRSMIDFPDIIDFGNCPVKYNSKKPIIIRNLGEKTTKWQLQLPEGFSASKIEGVLEYQKNEQIILNFFPLHSIQYNKECSLLYDGLQAYTILKGNAYTGDVRLGKTYLKLDKTYISLKAQSSLQINN